MRSELYILLLSLISCGREATIETHRAEVGASSQAKCVMLQPYENFRSEDLEQISKRITENYGFEVVIADPMALPRESYVHIKSPRYRADSLIAILKRSKPDSVEYVLGLTTKDISFTKKDKNRKPLEPQSKYHDWGVFGLGYVPGPSSIVSTYRLGSASQYRGRLYKVSLHELGHNMGLPHCDRALGCVMRDAAESIGTVDAVDDVLCDDCRADVGM